MIEITKANTIAFTNQEIPWLFDVEKGKKTEDGGNLFFKALANRFWLTSKNCSCFSKVAHGRTSIKWTT